MCTSNPPYLMGILNVTPDSFSDGGRYAGVDQIVEHGLRMAREGASFIDVGGESTRPGSKRVAADEQRRRVVDPIRALRAALDREGFNDVVISIDTTLAEVAEAALDAGAGMLNDVSAGRDDPPILSLAAECSVPLVLMHMLGQPGTMQDDPRYGDVVAEVLDFLMRQMALAQAAGVAKDKLLIDPGIGFGKTVEHNVALLGGLDRLVATGYGVLLGASRKRFIQALDTPFVGPDPNLDNRLGGTIAATLRGLDAGVSIVRVHEVGANRQALAVGRALGFGVNHR